MTTTVSPPPPAPTQRRFIPSQRSTDAAFVVAFVIAVGGFTTIGWAAGSIPPASIAHETSWLIAHEPDVLMAWIGFGLFLAVAVTSMQSARRKTKRETWYFVHLYAYLAIALSFAHQLAVGS